MRWNRGVGHGRIGTVPPPAKGLLCWLLLLLTQALLLVQVPLLAQMLLGQSAPGVTPPANEVPAPPVPAHALFIMIDAAHGGSELGAVLNAAMPEKDVNLAIARRLRQELLVRGIQASLVRDGDSTLSSDQRARIVNAIHPALYIAVHTTSQGSGMRLYTAMLPAAGESAGPFVDWQTAQASALPRSRWIQEQISSAIQKMGFPLRSLIAPLRPLNNVIVPALAVEIAPTTGNVSQLAASDYQQMVTAALANSLAAIRAKLEPAP